MKKNDDKKWLKVAVTLSKKAPPTNTAFCVGSVIVDQNGNEITTGYSRENGPHKHAEQTAIEKAKKAKIDLTGCTLYSSLEPCGERLSGRKPCVDRIVEAGIKRVVFGNYEPSVFVKAKGEELLKRAGIETVFIESGQVIILQ